MLVLSYLFVQLVLYDSFLNPHDKTDLVDISLTYTIPIGYQAIGIRVRYCSAALYYVSDQTIAFYYVYSQYIYLPLRFYLLS